MIQLAKGFYPVQSAFIPYPEGLRRLMIRKRTWNLPLLEAAGIAVLLHVVLLALFGGIQVYQYVRPPETAFTTPPPIARIEPQRLEYQARVKQRQSASTRPRQQRLTVTSVADMSLPEIELNLAPVTPNVGLAGNGRGSGGGLGSGFARGGLGFGTSAVNFFGIKSQGERVFFIVDATDYMLEDRKGGFHAYGIVKEELVGLVDRLSAGTLFNLAAYGGREVNLFSPRIIPATTANKNRVRDWIEPVNRDPDSRGPRGNDFQPRGDIAPVGDRSSYWVRALQAAMEQNADSIFLILSQWQFHGLDLSPAEEWEWLLEERGWSERKERSWNEAVAEAWAWLENENTQRRSRGEPPRIANWIGSIVAEIRPDVQLRTAPSFEPDEIEEFIGSLADTLYPDGQHPRIHIVLFLGEDEERAWDEDRFKRIARRNGGRFRVLEGFAGLRNVTGS